MKCSEAIYSNTKGATHNKKWTRLDQLLREPRLARNALSHEILLTACSLRRAPAAGCPLLLFSFVCAFLSRSHVKNTIRSSCQAPCLELVLFYLRASLKSYTNSAPIDKKTISMNNEKEQSSDLSAFYLYSFSLFADAFSFHLCFLKLVFVCN